MAGGSHEAGPAQTYHQHAARAIELQVFQQHHLGPHLQAQGIAVLSSSGGAACLYAHQVCQARGGIVQACLRDVCQLVRCWHHPRSSTCSPPHSMCSQAEGQAEGRGSTHSAP